MNKTDLGGCEETGFVRCNNCYNVWLEEEIPFIIDKEDNESCKGCPDCETDGYLMDITQEQYEELLALPVKVEN